MKRPRFSEERVAFALRHAPVPMSCAAYCERVPRGTYANPWRSARPDNSGKIGSSRS